MRAFNSEIKLAIGSLTFFIIGAISLTFTARDEVSQEREEIERNVRAEMSQIQRDMVRVLENLENNSDFDFSDFNDLSRYPFFVYRAGRLAYWSDYRYVPDYRSIRGDYRYRFVKDFRKNYIVTRWEIEDRALELYALLPLYTGYKIENDYVKSSHNTAIFPAQNVSLEEINGDAANSICITNKDCLFSITIDDSKPIPSKKSLFSNLCLSVGVIFLILFALRFSQRLASQDRFYFGLSLLIISLLSIRWVMLELEFPHVYTEGLLFDSSFFASSAFNPSLGDLLINIVLFCLTAAYIFYNQLQFFKTLPTRNSFLRNLILPVFFIGLALLIFHFEFLIFQTLYHNSQLTFDINQSLAFGIGRIIGFAIILFFIATVFFVFHTLYMAIHFIKLSSNRFVLCAFIGATIFSLINIILGQAFLASLTIGLGVLMVVHYSNLFTSVKKLKYRTFLYFFVFMIGGSALGTFAIYDFEKENSFKKKKRFADQLLIQNDNLGEFLLDEANEKIKNDRFVQSRMSSPFFSKEIVETKIRQVYLGNYFDKYDIDIYLFNSSGKSFDDIETPLSPQRIDGLGQYRTSYDNIYFVNNPNEEASKRYLNKIEIRKRGLVVGYIIIDLNLKRIIPESVYPELLVDHRLLMPFQNNSYSYSIFVDGKIQYSSGDFNYSLDFDSKIFRSGEIFESATEHAGYWHTAVKDAGSRIIVISSNDHPFTDVFSNFSFLFLLQVFSILIVSGAYSIYFALQTENLNYSAKIQLYLNLAFFMPLIAVSFTTLSLINSSFEKEVNQEYFKKAESISNNVSDDLNNYVSRVNVEAEELRSKLTEVSNYSGADVNLFNTSGRLIASSQPLIFENDLLSEYINPVALSQIKERGKNSYILQESVGSLFYNTTFFAVKSFQKGELIGIVSIPYFKSEYNLEQSQITVLTNVINVFTVVFIIFLIISYLASNWLTFPLRFITQKLKRTTLTGANEPLTWDADDEIGLMVGEYNKMLENLDQSKRALAKSEKESAWREIAQQVAHEIKNPLTPMKLTLQHLSRTLTNEGKRGEMDRPLNTLLQQIETLNDIASSFSTFAKMPIPEQERYELTHIVKNVVSLHKSTHDVEIRLQIGEEPVYTLGDEQLMGRIINNIMLNAIQASEGEQSKIQVLVNMVGRGKVRLEITDNGVGIQDEVRSKVFIPNFSTKERGSGIGLAIAKHGVEHAGGKIWFETEIGKGTSFFIELSTIE